MSAGPAGLRGRVGANSPVPWILRDGALGSKYPIKGVRHLLRRQLVRTGGPFVRGCQEGQVWVNDREARRLGQLCSMRIERSDGTVVVRLHGEFDLACARRFEDELDGALDGEPEALVLDLRGLQFMDSTGLRLLVTLNRTTSDDGIEYTVLCADGPVRHVLQETGLDGVLPVVSPDGAVPRSDSPV